jgi:hypothetical protein
VKTKTYGFSVDAGAMRTLLKRMIGAARLDPRTYEQVEADPGSTTGAVFTAVVASFAAAVGTRTGTFSGLISGTMALLMIWAIWVGLTYIIGTRVFSEAATHADLGEVIRTTGFSAAPGILRIFGLFPSVALPVFIAVTFWMLLAFVVAIQHAMDYSSFPRAFVVCFLGWIIHGVLFFGLVLVAL